MSMTLTDRLTRGTYLFDNGDDKPGVICLTYSWMSDAMKMLPLPVEKRVTLALDALKKIYPDLALEKHIIGDPITVSWEVEPHFMGAFKGALPGHYRYNHRMYCHFMQDKMPPSNVASSSRAMMCRGRRAGSRGGTNGAQCGVGHHASPGRQMSPQQPRTGRPLPGPEAAAAAGLAKLSRAVRT